MFRKLLIPIAIVSTLVGGLTAYGASTTLLPGESKTTSVASVRLPIVAPPTESPAPAVTATPSVSATPALPVSAQYTFAGKENLTDTSLLMKTTGKFKTYKPTSDKLYHVGKCVVSVYANSINGYYSSKDQQTASEKLVKQYTKTLKVKKVKVKHGYLYSNQEYGTDGKNYKIASAYSTFSAKAVHGIVHARMFNNGFGFIVSVTCPTKTKVPDVHKVMRMKTANPVKVQRTYSDDYRYFYEAKPKAASK